MARNERNIIAYSVALISEFANHFGIETCHAYAYVKRDKGMEHLHRHYNFLHMQSFPNAIETMTQVCINNGGGLHE